MAIEYMLSLATDHDATYVRGLISKLPAFEHNATQDRLFALGINDVMVSAASKLGQKVICDAFGFVPNIRITFILNKFERTEEGEDMVALVVQQVLASGAGDAVLMYEDIVLALRMKGDIFLNEDSSFWQGKRLTLFMLPYQLKPLRY